jgi:hypothetical protein
MAKVLAVRMTRNSVLRQILAFLLFVVFGVVCSAAAFEGLIALLEPR